MDKEILKRILGVAAILLLILFGMGIILPLIISTNKAPVSIILIVAITTIILGVTFIIHIVKNVLIGKRALDYIKDTGESLFNYDMESKK